MLSRVPGPILVAAVVLFGAAGCEQEPVDEPRGGGYVAESPKKAESGAATTEGEPAAKSTLGKAKQAAEKVISVTESEYHQLMAELGHVRSELRLMKQGQDLPPLAAPAAPPKPG